MATFLTSSLVVFISSFLFLWVDPAGFNFSKFQAGRECLSQHKGRCLAVLSLLDACLSELL
jgi:hypothetical protein